MSGCIIIIIIIIIIIQKKEKQKKKFLKYGMLGFYIFICYYWKKFLLKKYVMCVYLLVIQNQYTKK
jgi:hypothetical protein